MNEQVRKHDDDAMNPFIKILYSELFSSVVVNEFAKSFPPSAV